jgi:hypothetical protein
VPKSCHVVIALLSVTLAACQPSAHNRVAYETRQLMFGLNDVCLPWAFQKLSVPDIAKRAKLRPVRYLGYTGWLEYYRSPETGLRPINFNTFKVCNFNVGARNARPDDLTALDQAVATDLAGDTRRWHPVVDYNSGPSWCDASDTVLVHTFQSNPENPPPGIKAYIRKMQLQVSVRSDASFECLHPPKPIQAPSVVALSRGPR